VRLGTRFSRTSGSGEPHGPTTRGSAVLWQAGTVITECALLDVRPGDEAAFEAAFRQARPLIAVQPGFLSLRLERCVEDRSRYLLLVAWERLEDHTEGFRKSGEYEQWRELLHHFYEPFPTVQHFEPVGL